MHELHLGGLKPELNQGVRPDLQPAENTFVRLRSGQKVFLRASPPRRPSWASRPSQAPRMLAIATDPDIVVDESTEQDLVEQIERALAGGEPVNGFVGFVRTVTGAIKGIPIVGAPIVARDVVTMARLIDRRLTGMTVFQALGLDPLTRRPAVVKERERKERYTLADLGRLVRE